jgi:hypothetical protein
VHIYLSVFTNIIIIFKKIDINNTFHIILHIRMAKIIKHMYTLEKINEILYQGFEYKLPDETLANISKISSEVGAPDYIKTPVFQKRENPMKVEPDSFGKESSIGNKKRRGKPNEIVNDADWENIRSLNTTKVEEKTVIDTQIDNIRVTLNKMSDKNYIDMRNKIIDIVEILLLENITDCEMGRISSIIFDIASTNRFYSKMYAELYADLSIKYSAMRNTFEDNFKKFIDLFNIIEYVDPKVNYDKFCEINKSNEKRKSLAAFYLNLMNNGIIDKRQIMLITRNLLEQIFRYISLDDKKNEVDELTETVAILYKKEIYEDDKGNNYEQIEGHTISEVIEKIAKSKVKDYKSLTNKALFKFMDLIDM